MRRRVGMVDVVGGLLLGLAFGTAAAEAQQADAMRLFRDDCRLIDDLSAAQRVEITAKPRAFVFGIQDGLRAVYTEQDLTRLGVRAPSRNLTDGLFGAETQRALVAFCNDFPVLTENTPMARFDALFGSARHFAALAGTRTDQAEAARRDRAGLRDWRAEITRPAAVAALGQADAGVLRLRLAGSTSMVLELLGDGSALQTAAADGATCGPAATLSASALASNGEVLAQLQAAGDLTGRDSGAVALAFCRHFRVSGSARTAAAELLQALAHFGQLLADDPRALTTIASPQFGAWVTEAGDGPMRHHRLVRLAGSVPVVLALLAEFREGQPPDTGGKVQPPAPTADSGLPASCALTQGARYFELTAADFKAIAARETLAAGVAKLAGAQVRDADAAAALVAEALPGLDQCNQDYVRQVIATKASKAAAFELVDNGFANGVLFTLPPEARTALQALAKLPPPADRAVLTGQINQILTQTLQQKAEAAAARYAGQAAARAEPVAAPEAAVPAASPEATPAPAAPAAEAPPSPAFRLPAGIAAALKADGVPAIAADALTPLTQQSFVSIDTLTQRVAQAIAATLSRENASQLRAFETAVAAQIRERAVIAFEDATMAALQAMPALQAIDPAVLDWVQPLTGVTFPDHMLLQIAVKDPLNKQVGAPDGLAAAQAPLALAARKWPAVEAGVNPLRLTRTEDCGCVPWHLTADRDVYGFYPFWTAKGGAEPPPPPAAVDLSLFSRVAFFGARAAPGTDGYAIVDWAGWQPNGAADGSGVAGFVETVHRHNVKADLAVILDQWSGLDPKATDLAAVAEAVAGRMLPPPSFWSAVWEMVVSRGAVNGFLEAPLDAVTLYFPDMADAVLAEGAVAAGGRVAAVAQRFRQHLPPAVGLNIAFAMPVGASEDTATSQTVLAIRSRLTLLYLALAPVLKAAGGQLPAVDLVLVELARPTTESKKLLVRGIQDAFAGEERRVMLRKTIAVMAPNGHRDIHNREPALIDGQRQTIPQTVPFGQLEDDLSFLRDNFRGVGFWRLPLVDDVGYAEVASQVRQRFWTDDSRLDGLGSAATGPVSAALAPLVRAGERGLATARQSVCTHRILIRMIAAALLAGLLALAVASYLRCAVCMGIARKLYIPPVAASALAVVWAGLAIFDPLFAPFVVVWLLALLPLALLYNTAFGYIFRARRADDP